MAKSVPVVNHDLNLNAKLKDGKFIATVRVKPIVHRQFELDTAVWPSKEQPGALYDRRQLCQAAVERRLTESYQVVHGPWAPYYPNDEWSQYIDHVSEAMVRAISQLTDVESEP